MAHLVGKRRLMGQHRCCSDPLRRENMWIVACGAGVRPNERRNANRKPQSENPKALKQYWQHWQDMHGKYKELTLARCRETKFAVGDLNSIFASHVMMMRSSKDGAFEPRTSRQAPGFWSPLLQVSVRPRFRHCRHRISLLSARAFCGVRSLSVPITRALQTLVILLLAQRHGGQCHWPVPARQDARHRLVQQGQEYVKCQNIRQ